MPKPARYAIMISITLLPVLLLCCFFMCLPEDEIEVPKRRAPYKAKENAA